MDEYHNRQWQGAFIMRKICSIVRNSAKCKKHNAWKYNPRVDQKRKSKTPAIIINTSCLCRLNTYHVAPCLYSMGYDADQHNACHAASSHPTNPLHLKSCKSTPQIVQRLLQRAPLGCRRRQDEML